MVAPPGALAERLSFGQPKVWPPYTPAGPDYGIACGSDVTAVDLELAPLPGTVARVDGVVTAPGIYRKNLATNQLVTVRLDRAGTTETHYFRCLPADFPDLLVDRPGEPTPGWYLTTFGQGNSPASGPYVVILDERGAPVWFKRSDRVVVDAKVPAAGSISVGTIGQFFGATADDLSRRVYDLAGNLLADRRIGDPTLPVDHHDYLHLAGNRSAFVSYPLRQGVDLTALGAGFNADDSVVDGAIVETAANGTVEWVWSTEGHFADDVSTFPQRFGRYPGEPNGGEVDTVHINSIDLAGDGSGDYIVSARHLDTVFRVDRATGNVEWTLGPVASTDPGSQQLTIVGDPLGGPRRQHDVRLDGGVLTMFDNRTGSGPARVVAYSIDPSGGTATMLVERRNPAGLAADALGSARFATDGSLLIGWGLPLQPMFEELDSAGGRLLAISQIPYGSSYRIVKYPVGTFNRTTLRAQAGGELQIP
jgi:hypothetical protein